MEIIFHSGACGFNLGIGTQLIISGSEHEALAVTAYDETGFLADLPSLNPGRQGHGCSYFINRNGTKVNMIFISSNL